MANFWKIVDRVIDEADVVLMVVDARFVEKTRNKEIERKVASSGKTLITVINKADLVEKDILEPYKQRLHPCVFVSAQKFYGMTMLRHMILRHSKHDEVLVGVVGYPNTGKSSVINALKGKSSAGVSSVSGFTKGKQDIKVDNRIKVIDTPGVLSSNDDKQGQDVIIKATKNVKDDPDLAVFALLKEYPEQIMGYYGLNPKDYSDDEERIVAIARKLNRLIKGGEPDIETAARMVLQDWQKGKIQL